MRMGNGGFQRPSHGTYGAGGPPNWSVACGENTRITKIMVKHGSIVDGIGFEIGDTVLWFTGTGGVTSEIVFGCNEYVTQISGSEGRFKVSNQRHVTSLKIHTNVCPHGYGPFGKADSLVVDNNSFITPFIEDNVVVGFSGRVGDYLDSIAITLEPVMISNNAIKVEEDLSIVGE